VLGKVEFTAAQLEQRIEQYIEKVAIEKSDIVPPKLAEKLTTKTSETLQNFNSEDFIITAKHNDYAPWNLMQGENAIIGFDYADVEFDSRYYDVYHFTRAINTFKLKPIKKLSVIEECKSAFLEGYGLNIPLDHPTRIYFNIFFSLERVQMLLRARKRNTGIVGRLKTISQKRHLKWYLNELERMVNF